jgi:hypothetical protein
MPEGTPLHGDRSAWNSVDFAPEHAKDIKDSAPTRHNPWPMASGQAAVSDGSKLVATDIATQAELGAHEENESAHHEPVTLSTALDAILSLVGQLLGLDNQNAHTVLAGPADGDPAAPTMRALVEADLPEHTHLPVEIDQRAPYAEPAVVGGQVTAAQSFTCGKSGHLAYIDVLFDRAVEASEFTIRVGEDVNGTVLGTGESIEEVGTGPGVEGDSVWYRIRFDSEIMLEADSVYTIRQYRSGEVGPMWVIAEPYSRGRAWFPSGWSDSSDFTFTTWMGYEGGIADHGSLVGLGDDDHEQYALADGTRGDFAATGHSHKLDDLDTPDDNTDLDASAQRHGLLPKLSGNSGDCLKGDGTWGAAGGSDTRRQATIFTVEGVLTVASGAIRIYNKLGRTLTIERVFLCVSTAPTGAAVIVDVHKDGTTLFTAQSNRPQIAAGANTGETTTIEVSSWADGEYLTMDVDQIGSTVAGSNLTVHVICY